MLVIYVRVRKRAYGTRLEVRTGATTPDKTTFFNNMLFNAYKRAGVESRQPTGAWQRVRRSVVRVWDSRV